ncbi:unnamed protein product [Cochlearia groenlandica]
MDNNITVIYTTLVEGAQQRVDAMIELNRAANEGLTQLESDNLRPQTENTNLTFVDQRHATEEEAMTPSNR